MRKLKNSKYCQAYKNNIQHKNTRIPALRVKYYKHPFKKVQKTKEEEQKTALV